MSQEWNHPCCERCWFDGPWGVNNDGTYRMPTRLVDQAPEACCYCGGLTIMGIWTRRDPANIQLLCLGDHENIESWSRVGTRPIDN